MYVVILVLLVVSTKLFLDHRKKEYDGCYKPYGNYENITCLKHDLTKIFTVQLIPLLVYGIASGDKFYDTTNPLDSWVGKTVLIFACYFIFHEIVQPYIVNKMPYF
jgi:hypothetical protein